MFSMWEQTVLQRNEIILFNRIETIYVSSILSYLIAAIVSLLPNHISTLREFPSTDLVMSIAMCLNDRCKEPLGPFTSISRALAMTVTVYI